MYAATQHANLRVWANDASVRWARGLVLTRVHGQEAREERVRGEAPMTRRPPARTRYTPACDISRSKGPPKDTRRSSQAKLRNCPPHGPSSDPSQEIRKRRLQGRRRGEVRRKVSYTRSYYSVYI